MVNKIARAFITLLIYIASVPYLAANPTLPPLRKSEILALVAGGIFPENVAHDIESRGIDFAFDETFGSLLQTAGGDPHIINALQTAKPAIQPRSETIFEQALLQHLSYVGGLIHSGKTQEATTELESYLSTGADRSEFGFVMGEILIVDRRFVEAAQVYAEILKSDPDFPELQQRLSVAHAESGDTEEAPRGIS